MNPISQTKGEIMKMLMDKIIWRKSGRCINQKPSTKKLRNNWRQRLGRMMNKNCRRQGR